MHQKKIFFFCMAIWWMVGLKLILKGVHFLEPQFDGSALSIGLIGTSCFIGGLKGHFLLKKSARKTFEYVQALKPPVRFFQILPKRYFFILGLMGLLGFSLKMVSINPVLRGLIDLAVGCALLVGSQAFLVEIVAFSYSVSLDLCGFSLFFLGYWLMKQSIFAFDFHRQILVEASDQYFLIKIGVSLIVGFFIGKTVVKKIADQVIQQVVLNLEPLHFKTLFPVFFYLFIAIAIGLSWVLSVFIEESVNFAALAMLVSTAWIVGALHFLKKSWMIRSI